MKIKYFKKCIFISYQNGFLPKFYDVTFPRNCFLRKVAYPIAYTSPRISFQHGPWRLVTRSTIFLLAITATVSLQYSKVHQIGRLFFSFSSFCLPKVHYVVKGIKSIHFVTQNIIFQAKKWRATWRHIRQTSQSKHCNLFIWIFASLSHNGNNVV